jgi:hypothetical protein
MKSRIGDDSMENQQLAEWMYLVIWEFQVRPGMEMTFESIYGPGGAWVRLFEQSADFLGTELSRDEASPSRYLTLDFWSSREAYEQFQTQHAAEYKVIDAQCEQLTVSEREIGRFNRARIS